MHENTNYVPGRCRLSIQGFHGSCAQWHDKRYILYNILLGCWTASYSMGTRSPSLEGEWGGINLNMRQTSHLHVLLRLRMSGSVLPLPQTPSWCAHMVLPYITICVPDITIWTPTAQPNFGHLYQCFIIYHHSCDTVTSSSNLWSFCQQFCRLIYKVQL